MTGNYLLAKPLTHIVHTYKFPSCARSLVRMYNILQFRSRAQMYSNRCLGSTTLSNVLLRIHVQMLSGSRFSRCLAFGNF